MTLLAVALMNLTAVAEKKVIPLWQEGAPTSNGLEGIEEKCVNNRISDVSNPELWVYPAKDPNGMMLIICPGGGYMRLAIDHEGTDLTDWLNSRGISCAVLKYRMPNGHPEVPLEDSRRAISIVRDRAAEWGVDPQKVGIMGSSAGGHFAATLATLYGDNRYRPDFQVLLYPVISMGDDTHMGSRKELLGEKPSEEMIRKYSLQNNVTEKTPQAFIALSADDGAVPPSNSLNYAEALIRNKVPVTLHVYPTGGHGWGFRDSFTYKQQWTMELEKFLNNLNCK